MTLPRTLRGLTLLLLLAGTAVAARAMAQETGSALISFPRPEQPVEGLVVIAGTAVHREFERYELAFAYDPDPTGTWFPIGDPGRQPVLEGELARWDVSGISDGRYALRLQVFGRDGTSLETVVSGVILQNSPPTPTPSATAPEPSPTWTPAPLVELPPTGTPRPTPESTAASGLGDPPGQNPPSSGDLPSSQEIWRYFRSGVGWTFLIFMMMGLYTALRSLLRPHLRRWLRETLENLQR